MRYLIILVLILTPSLGWGMEVNFFGVSGKDFKDRNYFNIAVGMVTSLAVHEAGHFAMAEINGGGARFEFDSTTVRVNDSSSWSSGDKQMFFRAGFLAQLLVGGILTAIPETRHSDFAVGFNGFTAANTAAYIIFNPDGKYSDIRQLNHGVAEGLAYTAASGILTYYNLNKED